MFQPDKSDQWWSVAIKVEGGLFVALLPKPKKSLKSFRYYIEATDKALNTSRTGDFTASVIGSPGECKGRAVAAALSTASLIVQGPAGIVALPAGFATTGVIAGTGTATAAGSAGAAGGGGGAAGAGAATGGGLGAGALVAGGVAAAAGIAVAVKGSGDSGGDRGIGNAPSSGVVYSVVFPPGNAGLNVLPCGGVQGGAPVFNNQNVTSLNGAFDTQWPPLGAPLVRVTGTVTATTFQAILACTNGALTGSISASGGPTVYNGTFVFGSSQGNVTATKQ